MRSQVILNNKTYELDLIPQADGRIKVQLDGREVLADVETLPGGCFSVILEGQHFQIDADVTPEGVWLERYGMRHMAEVIDPRTLLTGGKRPGSGGPTIVKSPMPGKVIKLLAVEGQTVRQGEGVVIIEAMKMQNELKSPMNGVVGQIFAQEGASVETNGKLMQINPPTAEQV